MLGAVVSLELGFAPLKLWETPESSFDVPEVLEVQVLPSEEVRMVPE